MMYEREKSSDQYRDKLSPQQARRYDELVGLFKQAGASDPELRAYSEASEGIPQAARFSFLQGVWRNLVRWRSDGFVRAWADERDLSADDRESLRQLVAKAAFNATWDVIMLIDEGEDSSDDLAWPGWGLMELDTNFVPTGREMAGIHESFISADPSGIEAADFR